MMSVQDVRRRRVKTRTTPPGFRSTSFYDWNNCATKRKRPGILSLSYPAKFLKKLMSKKKWSIEATKKKEETRKLVLVGNKPYSDVVGGDDVVVNELDEADDVENEIQIDDTLTPENYADSYDYFFHMNENRKDVLRVINRLGELLVFYEVEGDLDDWAIFVEKMEREKKEWRQRCRHSNDFFERTGKILGVEEKTRSYRMRLFLSQKVDQVGDYLRRTFSKAKEEYPLLGILCPCTFPSSVERVRSIYSDTWHWDEPVPD